jgi:trehalose 6-phosphate synthase
MNLVSKEYSACNVEEDGVLLLSEFAGSAARPHTAAIVVNPHDIEGTAAAIHTAFVMSLDERQTRMRRLRAIVRRENIYWWIDAFLRSAISRRLGDFPEHNCFTPQEDVREPVSSEVAYRL